MNKFFSLIAMLLMCTQASASSINISPTSLRAKDSTPSQVLTFINKGNAPVSYQFQIYTWTQVDGKEVLTPTNEVITSPRIVEIAPKAKQVIRVIKPMPTLGKASYYRLYARELPRPTTATKTGITNPIYHNLPVSFEPANAAAPVLSLKRQGKELAITNTGAIAARVTKITTTTGTVLAEGALGWALPGSMKLVYLKDFEGSQVIVTVNGKPQTLSVL